MRGRPATKKGQPLSFMIKAMHERHWPDVRRIYAEGLRTGLAAFATRAPQWENWDRGHLQTGRLIARDSEGCVAGWAALTPVPDT
jgi:L-amino acid N-acyltransferase YncA